MIEVNKALVDSYFKEAKRHPYYKKTIRIHDHLSFHIDGYHRKDDPRKENPFFDELIAKRRPNESPDILSYRKDIFLNKTTQPCFKVINSLKKIVKSQDWKIDYDKSEVPNVVKDESLMQYCEKDYPVFKSLENWLYTYGIKYIITDPNSLIYVEPYDWDIPDNEKWKPVAKFVDSEHVYDYKEGEYAVFQTDRTTEFVVDGQKYVRPIKAIMTKEAIYDLIPYDLKENHKIEVRWQHDMNKLFCFKSGGIYKHYSQGHPIYLSFINPMISGLDAVAREISDLDAEVVQHIFSTMWYIAGQDCKACNGTGKIIKNGAGFMNEAGQQMACPKCEGNGRLLKSPYKDMVINPKLGDNIQTPPAGYINKPTEIVELQDRRIAKHIFDALSSLNMEFLAQTPLNESGVAKEVDRDELNNYVYGVAYHLVENVLKPVYELIADMRYGELVKEVALRYSMLPQIAVPEKYDLLSTNTLFENYKKSKESNLDMNIVNEIENDIINKLFCGEQETRAKLMLIKQLDPLRGLSMEDRISMKQLGAITKEDLVTSNYITQFVTTLLREDEGFAEKDFKEQEAAVKKMADEKMKELDEAAKLQAELLAQGQPPQSKPLVEDDEE